jgi:hypothetical protein
MSRFASLNELISLQEHRLNFTQKYHEHLIKAGFYYLECLL